MLRYDKLKFVGHHSAMKIPCWALALILFAICASAQTSSAPRDVTVLQNKWRIELHSSALEKDPFGPNKARQQEEIDQKERARESEDRIRRGETALPPSGQQPARETGDGKLSVTYVYEMKVKNTGRKEIRRLTWEYVFFEPGTTQEAGRRQFVKRVDIKPGATSHVVVRSKNPPTGTIDATKTGPKPGDMYSEQVVIRSIGYADGSAWWAPLN